MFTSLLSDITYWFLRGFRYIVRLAPVWLGEVFAICLGYSLSFFFSKEKKIAVTQLLYVSRHLEKRPDLLSLCRNDGIKPGMTTRDATRLFRRTFVHMIRFAYETLAVTNFLKVNGDPTRIESYLSVDANQDDFIRQGLAKGQGIVSLCAHVGCFELLCAWYAKRGLPIIAVGQDAKFEGIDRFSKFIRHDYGAQTLWRSEKHMGAKLISAVRHQNMLGVLIDQDTSVTSYFTPFFGLDAAHPEGPIRLALKFGLPITTNFIVREGIHKHRVISLPVEYDPKDPQAFAKIMHTYSSRLEAAICQYPEQWFWWHRRWRRRPGVNYDGVSVWPPRTNDYLAWLENQ